jgi:hypothetical protein
MQPTAVSCTIEPFTTTSAALKTSRDPAALAGQFHDALIKELSKQGVALKESHPSPGQADFTIEGSFILIDEGDRALRYFLSFLAGAAIVEVKGRLFQGDVPVTELHARTSQSVGVFGGDPERMLRQCATTAGRQIAAQVCEAIVSLAEVTP